MLLVILIYIVYKAIIKKRKQNEGIIIFLFKYYLSIKII